MRHTFLFVLLAFVLAIVTGLSIAWYRVSNPPYNPSELIKCITSDAVPEESSSPADSGFQAVLDGADQLKKLKRPILEVDRLFRFGVMQNGESGKHSFLIKNRGDADLTLTIDETSCKCTAATIGDSTVKPGMTGEIDVTWKTADFIGEYTQKVLVKTNDPDMSLVELEIRGKIVADARAIPADLSFPAITLHKTSVVSTQIVCYKQPPLTITQVSFLNERAKDSFDIQISELPAEIYGKEPDATGGYKITVTAKDNLPQGPFKETLILKTDSPLQPEIQLPVTGNVVGSISVAGPGWSAEDNVWVLGLLEKGTVGKRVLWILDRSVKTEQAASVQPGQLPEHIKLEIESVEPAWLQVELKDATYLPESGVVRTLVSLTVPENAPVCDYWGRIPDKMAKINLKTSSKENKSILIYVRFAVTNKE